MRVIVAAAGTGGHINPGLAIANKIKEKEPDSEIIFIGTTRGLENSLVPREGYELKTIEAYGLSKEISIQNFKKICTTLKATGNARKIMDDINAGNNKYDFIEIMACPGGCIDGGGQPFIRANRDILAKRMEALYKEDKDKKLRKSHQNPEIIKLYDEFLGEPNSEKAHKLLHTHYKDRSK